MSKLVFDIETVPDTSTIKLDTYIKGDLNNVIKQYSLSPVTGKIVCISVKNNEDQPVSFYGDEKKLLIDFWDSISDFNGTFVGFNSLKFDVPFIVLRTMKYDLKPKNNNFLNKRKFSFFPHFDCQMLLTDWGTSNRFISLNQACKLFDIETSKDGEVNGKNVYEFVVKDELNKIVEYCEKDVIATSILYERIKTFVYKETYRR